MKINGDLIPSERKLVPVFRRPFPELLEIRFHGIHRRFRFVIELSGKNRPLDSEFREPFGIVAGIRDERDFSLEVGYRVARGDVRGFHGGAGLVEILPDEAEQHVVHDSRIVGAPLSAFAQFQIRKRRLEKSRSPRGFRKDFHYPGRRFAYGFPNVGNDRLGHFGLVRIFADEKRDLRSYQVFQRLGVEGFFMVDVPDSGDVFGMEAPSPSEFPFRAL